MITQYFTFGQSHIHPHTGEKMKDMVIEIEAPTKDLARKAMVDRYGRKWAFQYDRMPASHPQGWYHFYIYETITVSSNGVETVKGYDPPLPETAANNPPIVKELNNE